MTIQEWYSQIVKGWALMEQDKLDGEYFKANWAATRKCKDKKKRQEFLAWIHNRRVERKQSWQVAMEER